MGVDGIGTIIVDYTCQQSLPKSLQGRASLKICRRWRAMSATAGIQDAELSRVLDRSLATVPCGSSPMSTLLRSSSASEEHCPSTPSGIPSPSAPMSLYYVMAVLGALTRRR